MNSLHFFTKNRPGWIWVILFLFGLMYAIGEDEINPLPTDINILNHSKYFEITLSEISDVGFIG